MLLSMATLLTMFRLAALGATLRLVRESEMD